MSYRSKRLRKKLRVGEFKEVCFIIEAEISPYWNDNQRDELWDKIIMFIESLGLAVGGTLGPDRIGIVCSKNKRGSPSESDRQKVRDFFENLPSVKNLKIGPFIDAWYGNH